MRLVPYLAEQTHSPYKGTPFLREWWPGETRVKLLETFPVCLVCSGVAFCTLSSQLHLPLSHGENRDSLCLISKTTLSLHKGKVECRNLLIHLCASQGTCRRVWQEDVMFVSRGAWSSGEGNIDGAGVRGENCWSVVRGLMKEWILYTSRGVGLGWEHGCFIHSYTKGKEEFKDISVRKQKNVELEPCKSSLLIASIFSMQQEIKSSA